MINRRGLLSIASRPRSPHLTLVFISEHLIRANGIPVDPVFGMGGGIRYGGVADFGVGLVHSQCLSSCVSQFHAGL